MHLEKKGPKQTCNRLVVVAMLACSLGAHSVRAQSLINAFPNLSFSVPVDVESATDGSNRLFVAELAGRISVFDNEPSVSTVKTFLDLRDSVVTGFERGFLGIALHPDFFSNGYLYAHYTRAPQTSRISRFTMDAQNPDTVAVGSELVILEQDQPFGNHNGGKIKFGPDGYLYIGFGDGGPSHDPDGNGQNTATMLGTILRLDVNGGGLPPDCGASGPSNYTVPSTNPLNDGAGGACDEIWAYGFRNPWRFSFDPDGVLWVGDVGQNCREEIDRVFEGGNYGWDVMEGNLCHPDYTDCTLEPPDDCSTAGLELPILDYDRNSSTGGRSVTGGYVYRGRACAPYLTGAYVYGDYITDNVWAMAFDGDSLVSNLLLFDAGFNVVSFGEDPSGELLVVDSGGSLYKFDCGDVDTRDVAYPIGWQQISVPLTPISLKTKDVLAGAALGSPVYGFEGGRFHEADWLAPGRGYLAFFTEEDTVRFAGNLVDPRTIPVSEGWNLIGGFEEDVAVGDATGAGGATVITSFFGLSGGYSPASTLETGRGYWVAVDSDGWLQIP